MAQYLEDHSGIPVPEKCDECGCSLRDVEVKHTPAGYYLGVSCNCGPSYARLTGYFRTREQAQEALDSGEF